ncbi:acyl carrier protein [bacterium]|nr:acyl carrier protein [bacterium]
MLHLEYFQKGACNVVMSDVLEQEIKKIIAEVLEVEPEEITAETSTEQIAQLDSVAMLEVLVNIERFFNIEIKETDLSQIKQLSQVIDLVRKKMEEK